MKTLFTIFLCTCLSVLSAQPTITGSGSLAEFGLTFPLNSMAVGNPGPAGNNQIWDFSSAQLNYNGIVEIINPSAVSLGSSFPTSNWGFRLASTAYSMFELNSTEMLQWSSLITSTGGDNDYSANSKKLLQFPMDFGASFTDQYIEQSSTNDLTWTYDGFGTLVMPGGITYSNVARLKGDYDSRTDYHYYTLDPLFPVAVYQGENNTLFWLGIEPSVSIQENTSSQVLALYPNPVNNSLQIKLNEMTEAGSVIEIYNAAGQRIQSVQIGSQALVQLDCSAWSSGIYTIRINDMVSRFMKE